MRPRQQSSFQVSQPSHLHLDHLCNFVRHPSLCTGSPPIWAEQRTPLTVPRDSGEDFIDQNGHHMKRKFTLLPLIRAVQTIANRKKTASEFDWPSVDFVADRGALRKLAAWANNKSGRWRMDTQLAGDKTVLINGWPLATKQTIGHSESYGFNFEKACTHPAPGCESGTGHHRIITYVRLLQYPPDVHIGTDRQQGFGGLTMVVRFEVDACLPFRTIRHRKSNDARNRAQRTESPARESDMSTVGTVTRPTLRFPHVAVIQAGSRVPQSHLIELKTYSGSRAGKHWSRSYPQLFLSQTPHIYYGAHKNGKFSDIKKYSLGEPRLKPIDQNAQVGFKKLKVTLKAIQELVRKHGTDGRISLVCNGRELGVYQRECTGSCLPKYAMALFRS